MKYKSDEERINSIHKVKKKSVFKTFIKNTLLL
jgi:hypothetical protein